MKSFRTLFVARVALIFLAYSGIAGATSINFADFQADGGGNSAVISSSGIDMRITAGPAGSLLSIGSGGLGVDCIGGYSCILDDADEIDGFLNETIRIDFLNGPVSVQSISFANISSFWILTDSGHVDGVGISVDFEGQSWWVNGLKEEVEFDDDPVTDYLLISATGFGLSSLTSDFSIEGLDVTLTTVAAAGNPVSGVPEPSAAMLFLAGGLFIRQGIRGRQ